MANLVYFTVTGTFLAAVRDSVYDVDNDPELTPMTGSVVLTPLIDSGDSLPAPTLTPPANLWLVPIKAQIRAGKITANGATGVKLVANTAVLGLAGNLYYRVDYPEGLTAGGKTYQPDSFTFQAPLTATTVDLVEVTPLPGHPAFAEVLPVVTVAGQKGNVLLTVDDLGDAQPTGKDLTRSETPVDARTAIHALAGTIVDPTGTVITNKAARIVLDSNGEIDDIIMEGI